MLEGARKSQFSMTDRSLKQMKRAPSISIHPLAAGRYFVEYTFQAPGQMKRHLMSSIGMGFDGTYNRLYTVTAQVGKCPFANH